jgi:DNA-directed RNA polymerase specialized sigma24 family protein
MTVPAVEGSTHRSGRQVASGMKRLDPEVWGVHHRSLISGCVGVVWLADGAEDLAQETVVRVLPRPRLLRGEDELAYLMQALRNTFVTSMRTAARRRFAVCTSRPVAEMTT